MQVLFLLLFSFSLGLSAAPKLSKDQRVQHAASRLTFGPTAETVAEIRKLGVEKWVDRQLRPESIPENPVLLERLKALDAPATERQVLYANLADAKLLRAVYSNRQLEELLVDFWFNHFNVYFDKGANRTLVASYERDAIRPHVLGKFKDLLLATAHHPAMLFYLDNWTSVSPDQVDRMRKRPKRAAGLNENYARELLELHTLGVDNGYTQQDVTEVARCFTGWSIADLREAAKFQFRPLLHDRKEKRVLGHVIPAGRGEEDGLQVIDILANHPATARFLAKKLAQRFVADAPPETLVAKMAAAFTRSGGDLREMTRTMLRAPEFWSAEAYRAKMKMPFEMVVSALRATGAQVERGRAVHEQLRTMGQPLYRKAEPTGYYPFAEEWTNSSSLLARMNFGLALAQNQVRGVRVDAATHGKQAGLALGSPEFQRR